MLQAQWRERERNCVTKNLRDFHVQHPFFFKDFVQFFFLVMFFPHSLPPIYTSTCFSCFLLFYTQPRKASWLLRSFSPSWIQTQLLRQNLSLILAWYYGWSRIIEGKTKYQPILFSEECILCPFFTKAGAFGL
jgi:hypothetical protein